MCNRKCQPHRRSHLRPNASLVEAFSCVPRQGEQPWPYASHAESFLLACPQGHHSDASGAAALASNWSRSRLTLLTAQSGSWVKGWRT